jgi:putative component of toxin-antitoxin plasmid stabilization module
MREYIKEVRIKRDFGRRVYFVERKTNLLYDSMKDMEG